MVNTYEEDECITKPRYGSQTLSEMLERPPGSRRLGLDRYSHLHINQGLFPWAFFSGDLSNRGRGRTRVMMEGEH